MKKGKKILIYLGSIIGGLVLIFIILNFFYKTPFTDCMNDEIGESFVLTEQHLIKNKIITDNSNESYKKLYIKALNSYKDYNTYQIEDIKNAVSTLNINIETCSSCKYCLTKGLLFNSDLRKITSINKEVDNIQMTGKYPKGTPDIYTYENFDDYLSEQIDAKIFSQDAKLFVLLKIKHQLL